MNRTNFHTFCVGLTEKCNLDCDYCYFQGKRNKTMSKTTAKKSIDFFIDFLASKEDEVRIIFVGGEVLTEFKLLKELTEYSLNKANSKVKLNFSLDTNATLLTKDVCEFLKKHSFFVMASLDYPKESHNLHRVFKNTSKGNYDLVLEKIKLAINVLGREFVSVRATINPDNVDKLSEYVKTMVIIGVKHIDFAPNYEVEWDNKKLVEFSNQIKVIKNKYYSGKITIKILERFIKNEPTFPYGHPCGLLLTANVDGKFFPCTRFVNIDEFSLGSVTDNPAKVLLNIESYCDLLKDSWKKGTFGCPANNFLLNGEATKKSKIFKKFEERFREGLK